MRPVTMLKGLVLVCVLITGGILLILAVEKNKPEIPNWVTFPGKVWQKITAEEAGLDTEKFRTWVENQSPHFGIGYGGQKPDTGGVVLTRGGFIVQTWGDPEFRHQNKSVGKLFTRLVLQLALDHGLIASLDDRVQDYWTGEGELSHSHKYLNRGHHKEIAFRHFIEMTSGFPVTNGYFWQQKTDEGDQNPGIADWANWTGDPNYDNYAHVLPGEYWQYSSGGYWRLSQALTAIWDEDLKLVLDKHLMSKIGIPADRWEWLSGETVRSRIDFYPDFPNYGGFVDPPYEINGHKVRGGGGWVVMSAGDLARLGLLYATGGIWQDQQIISREFGGMYLPGNGRAGRNDGEAINALDGWGRLKSNDTPFSSDLDGYFSFGRVTTLFDDPSSEVMASWIVGPVQKNQGVSDKNLSKVSNLRKNEFSKNE